MTKYVEERGKVDESLGLVEYQIKWDPTRNPHQTFVVVGDVGKSSRIKLSSLNVPCIMVFSIPDDFLTEPCRMVAFEWFDGGGSYATFVNRMKRLMHEYRAVGYYDATNVQTALEDLGGTAGFASMPTTPIYFSGLGYKKWAVAVLTQMLEDGLLQFPYIKALWYQGRIFDPSSKTRADDIIATLLVLMLAFRVESSLYDKLAEKYKWVTEIDDDDLYDYTDPHASTYYEDVGRYDRL